MDGAKVSSRPSHRRVRLATATFAALVAAAVPAASAQEPGVVYEPGSPSDKEYAIPLEQVRRDAGGARPGKVEALAFGIGVSSRGRRDPRSQAGRAGRSGSPARAKQRPQPRASRATGAQARQFTERLADAEAADAPSAWKLGPLLVVLLPGLLVGLLLARREGAGPAT